MSGATESVDADCDEMAASRSAIPSIRGITCASPSEYALLTRATTCPYGVFSMMWNLCCDADSRLAHDAIWQVFSRLYFWLNPPIEGTNENHAYIDAKGCIAPNNRKFAALSLDLNLT